MKTHSFQLEDCKFSRIVWHSVEFHEILWRYDPTMHYTLNTSKC